MAGTSVVRLRTHAYLVQCSGVCVRHAAFLCLSAVCWVLCSLVFRPIKRSFLLCTVHLKSFWLCVRCVGTAAANWFLRVEQLKLTYAAAQHLLPLCAQRSRAVARQLPIRSGTTTSIVLARMSSHDF